MEDYSMSINGKNPNKSIEGMHSLICNIVKELSSLEDQNLIITECSLKVKAVDGPEVNIQEYEEYRDGDMTLIIDKTSIDRIKNFINVKNENRRNLILFLEKYSDGETHDWMTHDEYIEFITEFYNLYGKLLGHPYTNEDDYYEDYYEINEILEHENLKYKIRHVSGLKSPYKLDRLS